MGRVAELRLGREIGDPRQRRHQEVGPALDETRPQLPRRLFGVDRDGLRGEDRTGVEPGFDAHDADAGRLVAREHGAFDRRSTPPAWEEREVHVDETEREGVEHRNREKLPEGDDDADLRTGRAQLLGDGAGA